MSKSAAAGRVFVAESDYTNNGDIYCFTTSGTLAFKVDTGGINPMKVVFAEEE